MPLSDPKTPIRIAGMPLSDPKTPSGSAGMRLSDPKMPIRFTGMRFSDPINANPLHRNATCNSENAILLGQDATDSHETTRLTQKCLFPHFLRK
jgi:hypothetical protein